jgi:hypothetical protein
MSPVVNYWRFNRLNIQGKISVEEIVSAKRFLQEEHPHLVNQEPFSDTLMQNYLFNLLQQHNTNAEICLRCFISEQIKQVCLKLERQFGYTHQFTRYDLFPFVLDDTLNSSGASPNPEYQSMAKRILQKFEPQQGSLSTWTTRLVRYDRQLNQFLLERGLYLISDWAILNDTSVKQLERIFRDFHHLNGEVIILGMGLLQAYHQVYRQSRLTSRQGGSRSKCSQPTPSQLEEITQIAGLGLTAEQTLIRLQELAEKLREYRIFVRGGKPQQASLDTPEVQFQVEQEQVSYFQDNSAQESQGEFLSRYRQQFFSSLQQAIAQVLSEWSQRQKDSKKRQFLTALKLFHCQGLAMTEIATNLGLKAQYQVTRLIQLKNLRSDIRQEMLQNLRQEILSLATTYISPAQLLQQEQQIALALEEQVSTVMEQAEAEASSSKNQTPTSLFARSLCDYLDQKESD